LGYCVNVSDVDLLGDLDRVIDLNTEVADRALDLQMSDNSWIALSFLARLSMSTAAVRTASVRR